MKTIFSYTSCVASINRPRRRLSRITNVGKIANAREVKRDEEYVELNVRDFFMIDAIVRKLQGRRVVLIEIVEIHDFSLSTILIIVFAVTGVDVISLIQFIMSFIMS